MKKQNKTEKQKKPPKTNELTIYPTLCRNVTIFYRKKLASIKNVQEKLKPCSDSKWKYFKPLFHWWWQSCKNSMATYSSFQRTWYFTFSRWCPFIKILSSEIISELLLFSQLLNSKSYARFQIFVCTK